MSEPKTPQQPSNKGFKMHDLIITFLVPIIVGKIAILYFGNEYSARPGEGWGIALSIAISITVFNFIRFLWKYRHYKEDDESRP